MKEFWIAIHLLTAAASLASGAYHGLYEHRWAQGCFCVALAILFRNEAVILKAGIEE